jgi:hypothetical protein
MPKDIFRDLKSVRVGGQKLNISRVNQVGSDRKKRRFSDKQTSNKAGGNNKGKKRFSSGANKQSKRKGQARKS